MNVFRLKLDGGGRVRVPAKIRRDLGLCEGDAVTLSLVDGEIRVRRIGAGDGDCGGGPLSQEDREWLDDAPVGREVI